MSDSQLDLIIVNSVELVSDVGEGGPIVDFPFLVDEIFAELDILALNLALVEDEFLSGFGGELSWASGDSAKLHLVSEGVVQDLSLIHI